MVIKACPLLFRYSITTRRAWKIASYLDRYQHVVGWPLNLQETSLIGLCLGDHRWPGASTAKSPALPKYQGPLGSDSSSAMAADVNSPLVSSCTTSSLECIAAGEIMPMVSPTELSDWLPEEGVDPGHSHCGGSSGAAQGFWLLTQTMETILLDWMGLASFWLSSVFIRLLA